LQDIELVAQCAAVLARDCPRDVAGQIRRGVEIRWITPDGGEAMLAAYDLLWRLRAAAKLLTDSVLDLDAIGKGGRDFLLRETGMDSAEALIREVEMRAEAARQAIEAALGRLPGEA
jgi:glutamate-ammonia-ligase adenylyltransferase